jgi:hypothetical protein
MVAGLLARDEQLCTQLGLKLTLPERAATCLFLTIDNLTHKNLDCVIESILSSQLFIGMRERGFSVKTITAELKLKTPFVDLGFGGTIAAQESISQSAGDARSRFRNSCSEAQTAGMDLIIIIDEFDRLEDRRGLGALIHGSDSVRFIVVGIAETITDIIEDHESAGRKILGNEVPIAPMSEVEISDILRRAAAAFPGRFAFDEGYRAEFMELSGGFPWVAQLLGYFSLVGHEHEIGVFLSKGDLMRAVEIMLRPDRNGVSGGSAAVKQVSAAIGDSDLRLRLLSWLAALPFGKQRIEGFARTNKVAGLEKSLDILVKAKVIKRYSDGNQQSVRFVDPYLRVATGVVARFRSSRVSAE